MYTSWSILWKGFSAYLAWFLVYKSGLLPKVNILDIGAGSGYDLWPIFLKVS